MNADRPDGALTGAREAAAPRVSVVVATYNRADRVRRLLDGLAVQTLAPDRFEVVIVDDASDDSTAAVLDEAAASARFLLRAIRNPERVGPAGARDAGWRAAGAALIAFTDDDCVPTPGWLAAGLAACERNVGAVVQGRTDPDPAELTRSGPFTRTIRVPVYDAAFQTCNVFYPRAALERVGGFDVAAFGWAPGGEDADLAWRAIKAGAGASFAPEAIVHHAVNDLGPLGKLRVASDRSLLAYARHPELRRAHFANALFWKHTHIWLAQALAGALLPRRLWPLALWLALPWARSLYARGKLEGGGPASAPFYAAYDLAEVYACLRNSIKHRTLML